MVHGLIDYLTGPSLDAKILRDNFVFKIVPMLNPDGVIVGNYRCSLAGCDLNRCWMSPDRRVHPTIFHAKQMVKKLMDEREVVTMVDLHGHSRKVGVLVWFASFFSVVVIGCYSLSCAWRRVMRVVLSMAGPRVVIRAHELCF